MFLIDGVLPKKLIIDQRRKFFLKNKPFLVIARALYRQGIDQIIKRCVLDERSDKKSWLKLIQEDQEVISLEISQEERFCKQGCGGQKF